MVTYRGLKNAKPDTLDELVESWDTVIEGFGDAQEQVHGNLVLTLHSASLNGQSISAAETRSIDFYTNVESGVTEARELRKLIDQHATAIRSFQRALSTVESEIADYDGMVVGEDGVVAYRTPSYVPSGQQAEAQQDGLNDAADFTDDIARIVAQADEHDQDITFKLKHSAELRSGDNQTPDATFNANPQFDPATLTDSDVLSQQNPDPEAVAQWWDSLPPFARDWLIENQTQRIGGLDGLPSDVRHEANMITLREDIASGDDPDNARALLERIEATRNDSDPSNDAYLLGYEPPVAGTEGYHEATPAMRYHPGQPAVDAKVIYAVGNPDTADHTGIYVPGTGSDLESVRNEDFDRTEVLQRESAGLTDGSVSTIMWLGYDAPNEVLTDAPQDSYAVDGGQPFARFVDGVNAAHDGSPSHVTALGHSYGSTVVGQADVQSGLNVDDVVHIGSPGLGPEADDTPFIDGDVDGVEDLRTDPDHVWGMSAMYDPVNTEWHGDDPASPDFGGRTMAADNTLDHTGYWEEDGVALRNQALVITGQYDQVVPEGVPLYIR